MQSKFHIGQKVICKVDFPSTDKKGNNIIKPEKGKIYTIRSHQVLNALVHVSLQEVINKPAQYDNGFLEVVFLEAGFAPVENIKIDWSELASKELSLN